MTEKMKPSGFDYLGNIPASWDAKRFKYCVQICNGGEYADIEVEEGGYPVIGSGGEFARASKYCYRGESVLLGRKGTVDKPLYVNDAFWCVDTMFYTKTKGGMVPKFLYYCALGFRFDYYVTATALPSMTQKDLGSEMIAVPPTDEQHAIADFLDTQCAKIDSVIADIEKQIETLQKYKKSLITEAVTKGLDRVVPMKDSGVACIGLVPQNWTYKKLGYMAEVTKLAGFEFTDYFEYVDEGVIAVRGLNLKNFDISLADIQHIPEKTSDMLPRSQIHYNDVLISYAGTVGSVGLVTDTTKRYHLAPNVGKVTVLSELIPRYLAYYLISYAGQEHIDQLKNKNAQESISMENIRRIKVLVPSQAEQQNICDYLDEKVNEVDTIISGQQKKLELMHAHKKSLIYEYVTGKKRVTEVN